MAGKEFPLSIVLRTNDQATAGLQKLQRQLEPIEKKLEAISKKMVSVGKTLTTHLTLPIVAVGAASVKAMSDFQDGMASVETLIDSNTESIDEMGNSVLAIGKRTPVELAKLQEALYGIRSAGIPASDALMVMEKSAQLGVAGLGSTAEASDLVTGALNAFQLQGEDAAKVYDTIFKTVKNGKTDIAALAQGFGGVAGMVAATGTPLDEYLASVAALTTTNLPAAQAHTQLKAVIAGLTRETKESSKVFRKLGAKDFKDLIKQSGGMVPALEAISEELGGNEAKILKLVGSTEAMGAMMGLVGGQNKAFTNTLADMREGANAVDGAFRKKNETLKAQAQRTKNAMTSMGVSLGKILAPALVKIAEKVESVTEWFSNLDEGTKETIVTIAGIVAVVGPSLIVIGKLAGAIAMVTKTIRVMSAVMMANPIAALAAVIGLAALEIYRNWEDFEDFFRLLWGGVKGVFGDAWDFIQGIIDKVAGAVDKVIEKAREVKQYFSPEMERRTVSEGALERWKVAGGLALPDDGGKRRLVSSGFEAGPDETGMGAPALGADGGASLGGQGGQGGAGANGTIKVRFENPPKGMRANIETGSNLEFNIGDQMGVD